MKTTNFENQHFAVQDGGLSKEDDFQLAESSHEGEGLRGRGVHGRDLRLRHGPDVDLRADGRSLLRVGRVTQGVGEEIHDGQQIWHAQVDADGVQG